MTETAHDALRDAWRPLAEKALKGEPLATLDAHTSSGFALHPLYGPAEPSYLGRPVDGPWRIVQRVDGADSARQARLDLENGASELALVFAGAPSAHGRGLAAATVDDLDAALEGVMLDLVPVHLEAGARGLSAFALFAALCERRGTPAAALHAGLDPVGTFAATGARPGWAEPERLADAFAAFDALGVGGTVLRADGRIVAEAGASPVTELAVALHSLALMVRGLDDAGIAPDAALARCAMALSATEDQFATIAKLRAARRLHALMAQACGSTAPLMLHATTGHRMLAFTDPHTNLLRLTIAAFAAGVGGADSVTVLPFDAAGSAFARRMARNVQALLVEESHVGRLSDPGAGAGAVEAYTDALAEAAWALFQELEADGDAVASGRLAGRVAADAKVAAQRIEAKERVIVGVTIHPPQRPAAVPESDPTPVPDARAHAADGGTFTDLAAAATRGATLADLDAAVADAPQRCPPLVPSRAAAPYEG